DVQRTDRALQRREDIVDGHAERQRLFAFDVDTQLRNGRTEEGADAGQLLVLVERVDQLLRHRRQLLDRRVAARLDIKLESACGTAPAYGRRPEGAHGAFANGGAFAGNFARDLIRTDVAVAPMHEPHENGGGVGLVRAADQIDAVDRGDVAHGRLFAHRLAQL